MKSYRDLRVWQQSMTLVVEVYKLTKLLPKSELYGLCSQMQRAAVGIPSNIAKGYKRNHRAEYIHFLGIANGSASELETQLLITKQVYQLDQANQLLKSIDGIQAMLYKLIYSVKNML